MGHPIETSVKQQNYLELYSIFYILSTKKSRATRITIFNKTLLPQHTANRVQQWLTSKFGDNFISKEKCPPRSPDLNTCGYYIWRGI